MIRLGSLLFTLGVSASFANAAPPTTRTVVQHHAVFDLVGGKTNLRDVCDGTEPLDVVVKRTAGDVAAALFSGMWYTPVHVRVTCAAR